MESRGGTPPPSGDAADDARLMERVRRGDEAALGLLMERWERPIKAVIARLVCNAAEAEELAQETFVRVWQQREKFRAGSPFKPWVISIAINLARNRLRWWRRRPHVALEEWTERADVGRPKPVAGASRLEDEELADAVRDAIAALPLELREAIVLFEYEQLSQQEIAAIVGATPKAVETRIHRAKEKLRVALKKWM